jgi:hypothetical protein
VKHGTPERLKSESEPPHFCTTCLPRPNKETITGAKKYGTVYYIPVFLHSSTNEIEALLGLEALIEEGLSAVSFSSAQPPI